MCGTRQRANCVEETADLRLGVRVLLDFCGRALDNDTESLINIMKLRSELITKRPDALRGFLQSTRHFASYKLPRCKALRLRITSLNIRCPLLHGLANHLNISTESRKRFH